MERERFLSQLAQRLGRPRLDSRPQRPELGAPWPRIDESLTSRFANELARVGGTVTRARSLDAVREALRMAILVGGALPTVAAARAQLEAFGLDTEDELFDNVTFAGDSPNASHWRRLALQADLGITTASAAVASTGTLVLKASSESPRSLSLLPRRHLALLRAEQIVEHLGVGLHLGGPTLARGDQMPSALLCITGPSRTSDIENDLSIGVHGPADVHVIILEETHA